MISHAVSAHCVGRASMCLKRAREGAVAEGELVGAIRVVAVCMNEFGVILRSARLAVLRSHCGKNRH